MYVWVWYHPIKNGTRQGVRCPTKFTAKDENQKQNINIDQLIQIHLTFTCINKW